MKKIRKMKKKICITLAACLFASCPVAVMAAESPELPDVNIVVSGDVSEIPDISVQAVSRVKLNFCRQSNTVGTGHVSFTSGKTPSSLKATIALQQATKNSSSYRNSTQAAITATSYNSRTLSKDFRFTVSTTKKYRVKVVVKENVNGTVSTKTYYKNLE